MPKRDVNGRPGKKDMSDDCLALNGHQRQFRNVRISFAKRGDQVLLCTIAMCGRGKGLLHHPMDYVIICWRFLSN